MSEDIKENDSLRTLFNFADTTFRSPWIVVNDGVMGGLSTSSMTPGSGTGVFTGNVSLENNGGFASTRILKADEDLAEFKGIRIRIKGDSKLYQFRMRTEGTPDGVAFKVNFVTTGGWEEIDLPFENFIASYRGRRLTELEPMDRAKIRNFGFLIAEKQDGEFALHIEWIKAYK